MVVPEKTSAVIYWDDEDKVWIAHSLWMDQIGAGDRIVDALADLIRAMEGVQALAKELNDPDLEVFRRAPDEVFALIDGASELPREIYEVAHRMVHGQWPEGFVVEQAEPDLKKPYAAPFELVAA